MSDKECLHKWTLALAEEGFTYCEECRKAVDLKDLSSLELITAVTDAVNKAFNNVCQAHAVLGKEYVLFSPYYMGVSAFNGMPNLELSKIGTRLLAELTIFQQAISKEDALYPVIINVMSTKGCREEVIPGYDLNKHIQILEDLLKEFALAALVRDGYQTDTALSFLALNNIDLTINLIRK